MRKLTRILSILLVLTIAAGAFATCAYAKSASPVSLSVQTSADSTGYNGIITVSVTVKNNSGKDIRNVVVTSSDSTGLCMYRPVEYNVVVTNPGYSKPLAKKDAMTTCLKPGGTLKYVYCVLLGYQYAKRLVPEATRKAMLKQHKLLGTKDFRTITVTSGSCKSASKMLTFGDVKTLLNVKAYYNISSAVYDRIASGSAVIQSTSAPAKSSSGSSQSGSAKSGIRADYKEFWDSYVKFMTTVYNSDGSNSAEVLRSYADFMEKIDKYEADAQNPEETAYALESMAKVTRALQ